MAEFVEFNLEAGVKELEKLAALNLFDASEIRKLAQHRRNNAYNLQKRTKVKECYLRYITFEDNLLQKIKNRRKKLGIKDKVAALDVPMTQRLQRFFRNAVERNKSDVDMWMKYFEFCAKYNMFRVAGKMLQLMLQVHGDKAHLYQFASDWALKKTKKNKPNYETGRHWLVKGLERHPENKNLFQALVQFDLNIVAEAAEKDDKVTMKKSLACVEVSFKHACKTIPDAGFIANLTQIISRYPHTQHITNTALQVLEKDHADSEESWRSKAEWAFLHSTPSDTNLDPVQLKKYRSERAVETWEHAVKALPTRLMWQMYITFLKDNQDSQDYYFLDLLHQTVLPHAVDENLATEENVATLAEYNLNDSGIPQRAIQTLRKGLTHYPSSPLLWYELVRAHLCLSQTQKALEVFHEALPNLKQIQAKESVRLWTMIIACIMEEGDTDKVEELYKEGLRYRLDLAQLLKPRYLQWRFVTFGIDKARELLNDVHVGNPPCLAFYRKLAQIEASQDKLDLNACRHCHETILRLFGADNADLWIDYIKFEMERGDAKQVAKIYERGVRNLKKDQSDVLATKYSLIF